MWGYFLKFKRAVEVLWQQMPWRVVELTLASEIISKYGFFMLFFSFL